jgi:hypothetical protein
MRKFQFLATKAKFHTKLQFHPNPSVKDLSIQTFLAFHVSFKEHRL